MLAGRDYQKGLVMQLAEQEIILPLKKTQLLAQYWQLVRSLSFTLTLSIWNTFTLVRREGASGRPITMILEW